MKRKNNKISLGDLVAALYEEAAKVTSNKDMKNQLAYLALLDMQSSGRVSKVRRDSNRRPAIRTA